MSNFFVTLYNFFERNKLLLYSSLILCVGIMLFFTLQLRFEENITSFLPDKKNEKNLNYVFNNLKVKDKIVVMFSAKDSIEDTDENLLIDNANLFADSLQKVVGESYIKNITLQIDDNLKRDVQNVIYDNLPIFLTDSDYIRIDSILKHDNINVLMQRNYTNLLSPAGGFMQEYIVRDPLGIAGNALKRLQDFQLDSNNFEQIDNYIFTKDGNTLLMFITPAHSMGSTGDNAVLIESIEAVIAKIGQDNPQIDIQYYGGPSVAVYNAKQIKEDSILTGTIALIIIVVFISLAFKKKRTIPLVILPAIFGGLFALFIIYLIKGSISAIAVGAGSVILGIALSYSIHMIVHHRHVSSIQQLIKEITYPLTVGSFTTIGAFLGLLFTSSEMLRDFGLFASMTLIGTTLFCLIYLPHFLKSELDEKRGALLRFIEKFNAYPFDRNKWLVGGILVLTIICAFSYKYVGFDADMSNLNYTPEHIQQAEQQILKISEKNKRMVLLVSTGNSANEAIENYQRTNKQLAELKQEGLIEDFASADFFIIPQSRQEERIKKWNNYWTEAKKEEVKSKVERSGQSFHFRANTFAPFYSCLDQDFSKSGNNLLDNPLLADWQDSFSDTFLYISHLQLSDSNKEEVYKHFTNSDKVIVFDRAYFTEKWVSAVNDDFYLVLYISSFLIFFTLLLSYGRIELAFISFLPMFISWIIIIGIMGILGVEFNIITIILSTFIFGIGDDFSIFIMDGLLGKYRNNTSNLNGHKTAIFFSAFTIIVGMGALVFAQHPALQSISTMSILGMIVVVLVSYTIPPIVFRFLITSQTDKGFPPYTLTSLLVTFFIYILFVIGCISMRIVVLLLQLVPIKNLQKRKIVCYLIMITCRLICSIAFIVKTEKVNINKSTFDKPTIIIANHQSFTDILYLLSLSPKVVMVTNHWVWNSPFFGYIIRFAGYFLAYGTDGEMPDNRIKDRMDEGFSVIIFPEGTRSYDGNIKRFHKGAFYYADKYQLDITPIVLYGTGMIVSKAQPFYIKRGKIAMIALPIIKYDDTYWGDNYRERSKSIARYFKEQYSQVVEQQNNSLENPYFQNMLIKSYIYKGPVEEWYMRIKLKMEKNYDFFDKIIPRKATITDLGCGFGALCYMLKLLSPDRKIIGVDYDEDKITVAQNSYLKDGNIQFQYANAVTVNLPMSDVFIMNDMLHYINWEDQQRIIKNCVEHLLPNGLIIIRDGNKDNEKKQQITELTEVFSTKILKFNKTQENLCFVTKQSIYQLAKECNMSVESLDNDKYTSNTIFILKKNECNG